MLKIKDNVDLKELEKFGFKYVEDKSFEGDFSYCEKQIGGNIVLDIGAHYGKQLLTDITTPESNLTYIFSDGLDVLFDLIQAGLVEKVGDGITYKSGIVLTKDAAYQFVQYKETQDELWLDYTNVRPDVCYKIKKSDIIKIFDSYKQMEEYLKSQEADKRVKGKQVRVSEQTSFEDVLDYIGINYEGVKDAIIDCANTSKTMSEFFDKFHEYYSEHGLGGDDCWMDVRTYLPLVIKI